MKETKLTRTWDDICKRFLAQGREALNESELAWCNLAWLRFQLDEGGLQQYFASPWDYQDQHKDTLKALRNIGAGFIAKELMNIGELYGSNVPFRDEARNKISDTWARGGPEEEVIDQAGKSLISGLDTLDKKIDAFLLDNEFCDVWDLK